MVRCNRWCQLPAKLGFRLGMASDDEQDGIVSSHRARHFSNNTPDRTGSLREYPWQPVLFPSPHSLSVIRLVHRLRAPVSCMHPDRQDSESPTAFSSCPVLSCFSPPWVVLTVAAQRTCVQVHADSSRVVVHTYMCNSASPPACDVNMPRHVRLPFFTPHARYGL